MVKNFGPPANVERGDRIRRRSVGSGVGRQALGNAAGGRDGEDVGIAVVSAQEGDGVAVGGKDGRGFATWMCREADGHAALTGDAPEVAGI